MQRIVLLPILALAGSGWPAGAGATDRTEAESPSDPLILWVASPSRRDSLWVRITAPAAHPLFIVNCNGSFGWRLQAYRNAAWQEVRDGLMPACYSPPIRVEHGESMSFPVSRAFQPLDDLSPGRYRVVLHALHSHIAPGDIRNAVQVPQWQRISNVFVLTE